MIARETERNAFITQNMGLVYTCAHRLKGRGVEFEDLVQAGCVGLCKAVDAFDAARGAAFSTYAVPVILGEIRRLFREGGAVKVGRSTKERARALTQTRDALAEKLGRVPSVTELAESAGLEIAEAAMLLGSAQPVLSLTEAEGGGAEWELPTESPAEALGDRIALHETLHSLDENDRKLIELRYYRNLTQSKAGECLGMTQVQVSRREKAILSRLRGDLLP
ncbi:MAG: sigma-70 family RNA polymerase sigma factor [Oscillospiraceae bacterium]|jgi:RNA polymerase sporulation-specific sigma factor|nr:sigma-70 family RNA polymerase sigma factor [Oscillospiraceae bacterium]